jgi:hypothetical protein
MTEQEITSRIIKLQLEINKSLSNGHKACDTDEFQEKRIELKILRDILFKQKN